MAFGKQGELALIKSAIGGFAVEIKSKTRIKAEACDAKPAGYYDFIQSYFSYCHIVFCRTKLTLN
jgi:hypothetical protein